MSPITRVLPIVQKYKIAPERFFAARATIKINNLGRFYVSTAGGPAINFTSMKATATRFATPDHGIWGQRSGFGARLYKRRSLGRRFFIRCISSCAESASLL